jgi:hypothetical protein
MDAGGMSVQAIPPQSPARRALVALLERLCAEYQGEGRHGTG